MLAFIQRHDNVIGQLWQRLLARRHHDDRVHNGA
jgi:hypothetical protein